MPYDLSNFGLTEMLNCGLAIRRLAAAAETMEDAANAIVRHLHQNCVTPETGEPGCALVRFYKTHPYGALEHGLQSFVQRELAEVRPLPGMRCLTLLATAGDLPQWNSRHQSRSHRALPLASAEMVQRAPMIAQLFQQFGLELERLVEPSREFLSDLGARTYNVFHVEDARGSPYIPAQDDFVMRYGIRSVVGFGGSLPTGDLFAVVLFARVPVPPQCASRFRNTALDVKAGIFRFGEEEVFARAPAHAADSPGHRIARPVGPVPELPIGDS